MFKRVEASIVPEVFIIIDKFAIIINNVNLSIIKFLSNCVTDIYIKLKNVTQFHNTSVIITLFEKTLFVHVTPKSSKYKNVVVKTLLQR